MPAARYLPLGGRLLRLAAVQCPPACLLQLLRHAFARPACIGWFPGTCSVQGILQPKLCVQTSTVRRQGGQGVTHAYLAAQWLSRH